MTSFLQWARRYPDRPALSDRAASLSYAELGQRVLALAGRLRAAGLRPGDFAGVACERSVDGVIGILGVVAAGGAYVPLDLSYPARRLQTMLDDVQPRLVVATPAQQAGLPVGGVPVVNPKRGTDGAPLAQAVVADSGHPVAVLFSSGSTGRPKGSVLPRAALQRLIGWHVEHAVLGRRARVLQFVKFGFDVASCDIFATLAVGGTLVVAAREDRVDPFRLLDLLCEQRIERLYLPGAALRGLAQAQAVSRRCPDSLRAVLTAGEPLLVTHALRGLFAALPDACLMNLYGPSECVYVTSRTLQGDPQQWPDRPDIGTALPYARWHVVDEALRPVARGEIGELLIASECMADGYLNRPDATAAQFIEWTDNDGRRERVYRSGDQVREQADGSLQFVGRLDEQVKIAGIRLELGEVESALLAHPQIRQAAVLAPDGTGGPRLVACVVAVDDAPPDAALEYVLRAHMARELPDFARPAHYQIRQHLPFSANEKVDRRRLLADYLAADTSARTVPSATAPAAERALPVSASMLQESVLRLWGELLASPAISLDDNVFEHGADSLRVMTFITRLREQRLGELEATRVYELITPRQQAAALDKHAAAPQVATATGPGHSHPGHSRQGLAALRARNRSGQA